MSITSGTRRDSSPHSGHGEGDLIDLWSMGIEIREVPSDERAELGERSDRGRVHRGTSPDRERRPPVPLARDRPVDVVLEPVAVAPVLDVVGMPVDLFVHLQEALLDGRRAHVPGGARVVEQGGPAAPAERIRVLDRAGAEQTSSSREVLDDDGVGVLHEQPPDELGREIGEPAVIADRLEDRPPLDAADVEVLRAERRGHVDDAGAVLHLDERTRDDGVGTIDVGIRRFVPRPEERITAHGLPDGPLVAQSRGDERARDEQPLAVLLGHDVVGRRIDRDAGVRRERPRCRRPHEEGRARRARDPAPRGSGSGRRRSGPRRSRSPGPLRRPRAPCRIAGNTRSPCRIRPTCPRSCRRFSDHQTDSM